MDKLNRLVWTAGIAIDAYGVSIGIRTNDVELLERLYKRLPHGWQPRSNPTVESIFSIKLGGKGVRPGLKKYHLVYNNFTRLARTHNLDEALDALEMYVQLHIAEMSSQHVFVHAGVVTLREKVIIIPGHSHSGKSTLVKELVKAGAIYYSDEYAVFDEQGRVHPYPVPIGVRKNPGERQEKYPIENFGGVIGTKPLPVGLVLTTEYKEGARWRPKRIPAGQGLLAIMANTVSAQRNPAKALSTLQQVVLKAPVLKGVRGETGEVVEALLNRPWPTL